MVLKVTFTVNRMNSVSYLGNDCLYTATLAIGEVCSSKVLVFGLNVLHIYCS